MYFVYAETVGDGEWHNCKIKFVTTGYTCPANCEIVVDEGDGCITIKAERKKTKECALWFKGMYNTAFNMFDGRYLLPQNVFSTSQGGGAPGTTDRASDQPEELNFAVYGDLSIQFPSFGGTWYTVGPVSIGQGSFGWPSHNDWWIGSPSLNQGQLQTKEGKYLRFTTSATKSFPGYYRFSVERL